MIFCKGLNYSKTKKDQLRTKKKKKKKSIKKVPKNLQF